MTAAPRTLLGGAFILASGGLTFILRFGALGAGQALAGFDNDHFGYLVRAQGIAQGVWPTRDFVDYSSLGAWPPIVYGLSALAQTLMGSGLRAEALLTTIALAILTMATLIAVRRFTARWSAVVLAAAILFALAPNLYDYYKWLALVLAVWSYHAMGEQPGAGRVAALAGVCAVAFLLRHDVGTYVGLGALAVVLANGSRRGVTEAARAALVFVVAGVAAMLPTLIWIEWHGGLLTYIGAIVEVGRTELARTGAPDVFMTVWARTLEEGRPATADLAGAWLYAVVWASVAIPFLVARAWPGDRVRIDSAIGVSVLTLFVASGLLRHPIAVHLSSIAPLVATQAAIVWTAAGRWAERSPGAGRLALRLIAVSVASATVASAAVLGDGGRLFTRDAATLVVDRWERLGVAWRTLQGFRLLPDSAASEQATLSSLAACIRPSDRVLVAHTQPEVLVMLDRQPVAGQWHYSHGIAVTAAMQARVAHALAASLAPLVFVPADELLRAEFQTDYPVIWAAIARDYDPLGIAPMWPGLRMEVRRRRGASSPELTADGTFVCAPAPRLTSSTGTSKDEGFLWQSARSSPD